MILHFYVRFHTSYGQSLWILGNTGALGNNELPEAMPMIYLDDEFWMGTIEIRKKDLPEKFNYRYLLKNESGECIQEWEYDRHLAVPHRHINELYFIDTWNNPGLPQNVFYTAPFTKVFFKKASRCPGGSGGDTEYTHLFRVKIPLLKKYEVPCISGTGERLGNWNTDRPILMKKKGGWWEVRLNLKNDFFPLVYKYGLFNIEEQSFTCFEEGDNRTAFEVSPGKKLVILHDSFMRLPATTWKAAGVAIPVFSLRSSSGSGVGEFSDIRLLADWARHAGLKMIQLLPVNDSMAAFNWKDSYPYSAISAFALHPLYLNLFELAGKKHAKLLAAYKKSAQELNNAAVVDYETVMKLKYEALEKLYEVMGEGCLCSKEFLDFFQESRLWLEPYAVFCMLRDRFGTADFQKWGSFSAFNPELIHQFCVPGNEDFKKIGFYYFIQFHLHRQLKDATAYAHKKGVILKGDIPIGISRNSCDAWVYPELYNMNWQAGAPPDDFTAVGQNWGFPTYNWKKMQEDDFAWWKYRFRQMRNYFDAFRIDHILGFFRIWSIPTDAVQGIMGRFVPCIPVHLKEFGEQGIWFDYDRYCRPYITAEILKEIFGEEASNVNDSFLTANERGGYDLLPEFANQKLVETYFEKQPESHRNLKIRDGLFDLISNVLLFEEEGSDGQQFHFRISMQKTTSYRDLMPAGKEKLNALYTDYFYHRQDDFWYREAMHKLPRLKEATNMLVCGEDLGMVPHCVPDVMQQLGILSLEIQRMPKNPQKEFFHPDDAPYLSVITASTHDMSTIRGWWEENRQRTQQFYNQILGQWGEAPEFCEAWINRAIILQHLYSPAMWSVFQLQDIMGMNEKLRRSNPQEERINNPANTHHYWQYRMHISLEDLIRQKDFTKELREYIRNSGRG